jgi:hypothetical protein
MWQWLIKESGIRKMRGGKRRKIKRSSGGWRSRGGKRSRGEGEIEGKRKEEGRREERD